MSVETVFAVFHLYISLSNNYYLKKKKKKIFPGNVFIAEMITILFASIRLGRLLLFALSIVLLPACTKYAKLVVKLILILSFLLYS